MSETELPYPNSEKPVEEKTSAATGGENKSIVAGPGPAARRWRIFGRTVGVMTCVMSMAAGTVFGHVYWNSKTVGDMLGKHGLEIAWNTVVHQDPTRTWTPSIQFPERTEMNVLILGVDHDYDNRDQIVKASPGRSDSIMMAHVDFVRNTISGLTIPRDTAVRIPGYRGVHKINAAHNLGGPDLTMETIKSVFGVEADAYVTINFEGFQQIVDAIGGIDVNVSKKLDYDDNWGNLHIHLKPGYQHLTGYQAMGFVRMRHSDSDEMRSKRQHEFLEAMRAKVKSPSTFGSLPRLVDRLHDNLKHGSMTDDQLYALINFARSIPRDNITIKTLPSFEGPSYVTIYPEKSAELIQQMFFPNQQIALNIDAPDPNTVRSMNAPYERGGGGRRHRGRSSKAKTTDEDATTSTTTDTGEGSVQDPAPTTDTKEGNETGGGDTKTGSTEEKSGPEKSDKEKTDKSDKSGTSDAGGTVRG